MTRDIVLAVEIHSAPPTVFDLLTSAGGLAKFWTPDVEGDGTEGGDLSFGFAGAPSRLPVHVQRAAAPSEVVWECSGDWPSWAGSTVTWSLTPSEHGTKVVFRHLNYGDGLSDYDFGSVAYTWATIAEKLKSVAESGGVADPALG